MNQPEQNKRNQNRCPKCRRIVGYDVNGKQYKHDCMPKLICLCGTTVELDYSHGSNSNDDYAGDCPKCNRKWAAEDWTNVLNEL